MVAARPSRGFAETAHRLIVVEGRTSVKRIAYDLDLREDALYKRLRGEVRFTLDQAIRLVRALPDQDLVHALIEGSGFYPVPLSREDIEVRADGALLEWAVRATAECGLLLKATHEALADGRIDAAERGAIGRKLEELERMIAAIRHLHELPR